MSKQPLVSDLDRLNAQLAHAVWVTDLLPADIMRALRTARALRDAQAATVTLMSCVDSDMDNDVTRPFRHTTAVSCYQTAQ